MMKSVNLLPAAGALFTLFLFTTVLVFRAREVECEEIHDLAPLEFTLKTQGSALQKEAFRQRDLLPIYGSSELRPRYLDNSHEFFKTYPTGFNLYPIGTRDTSCLIMLQKLAAVGGELRGKKVAISLSPPWFFQRSETPQDSYIYNFSRLHAYELTFSTVLTLSLKQEVGKRLLQYPETISNDPLLQFALDNLSEGTVKGRFLYFLSLPLGRLVTNILRLQDHHATLGFIAKHKKIIPPVVRQTGAIPWATLLAEATRVAQHDSENNPFGVDNLVWDKRLSALTSEQEHSWTDQHFRQILQESKEWVDLELLLRVLHALGAQPLIMSMPIDGQYYGHLGMSVDTRLAYYQKLRELARSYQFPVLDFADHDDDHYFINDPRSHLSPEGWIYYNYALNRFYHGTLDGSSPSISLNNSVDSTDLSTP